MQAATQIADAAQVFGADDLALEPQAAHPIVPVPAPAPAPAGQVMNPHRLVEMAVERGMPIETIEKLLGLAERFDAMREAERKRRAESAYIGAIAGLKAEVVTVLKTKRVHYDTKDKDGRKSGSVDFKHAELADVMKALAAPAHRVGLTWNYPSVEQGDGWVRVTCRLRHVDGHFEDLTIGAPEDHSGKKNDIQAIASAITYLQRYTLKTILGIAEEGDDDFDRRSADAAREREEGGRGRGEGGGTPVASSELDDLMRAGESHAAKGLQALTAWWGALSGQQRELVGARFGELKKTAQGVAT